MTAMAAWLLALFGLAAHARAPKPASAARFVRVSQGRFVLDGRPYHYVGANLWYGVNLASLGPGGDRARLGRELDRLKALGVTNLRIMGLTQGPDRQPWRMVPALEKSPRHYNKALLQGLDYLLAEMGKRGMKAVVMLNNFWQWSGGMAQYHAWSTREPIPYPPPEPGGDWAAYDSFASAFYGDRKAVEWSDGAIKMLIRRKNSVTKVRYRDDPTIMAWELANEPEGRDRVKDFNAWLDQTASFIKSLDPNHLVTTGSEGSTAAPEPTGLDFSRNHSPAAVDYAVIHIWPQNWGWYIPGSSVTFASSVRKSVDYLDRHDALARQLGKPLVVEEFGLPRDSGTFDPSGATAWRDAYYDAVLREAYRLASSSGAVAGANFWAWAGEGRPRRAGEFWRPGDPWTGDPPHEPQGGNSVYDSDAGTEQVIRRYTALFGAL